MKLNVYTLKGVIYEGEIHSLNVMTKSGEITILDHHRPIVSILKEGEIRFIDMDKHSQKIVIKGGFLEMGPKNVVNILANS